MRAMLALMAAGATVYLGPPVEGPVRRKPPKLPKLPKREDSERQAAAQMKRERKQARNLRNADKITGELPGRDGAPRNG